MSASFRIALIAGLALGAVQSHSLAQSKEPPKEAPKDAPAAAQPDTRKVVKTADDLPRHTYKIEGKASELVQDADKFKAFASKVKADAEDDLKAYRIEDPTTLQDYHTLLMQIAVLEGHDDDALGHASTIRFLERKESKKLMTGQVLTAMINAKKASGGEFAGQARFDNEFRKDLDARIRALPWDQVREEVLQTKGRAQIITGDLIVGQMQGMVDKVIEQQDGEISGDIARGIVSARFALAKMIPVLPLVGEVYSRIIDEKESKEVGKDIWTPTQIMLTEADKGKPVVIGIWDSGVDTKLFKDQLWTNPGETPGNNKDDDNNGFVDDDHGIAYDLEANRVPGPLADLSELKTPREEAGKYDKAFSDLNNNIQSPEADKLRAHMRSLKPDAVTPFIEDLGLWGGYCHGTHVAGIAAAGNPYARILYARITFDHRSIPKLTPTIEQSRKEAQATRDTIDYFKKAGVRVVNMSFGGSRQDIEDALEAKGVGKTPDERASLAREMFNIGKAATEEAMRNAPDILFIAAAGNSDNDNDFSEVLPSGLNLPNLITVGAIDQTGKPTGFTTFGKNVKLYANGFEVDSYVPGGERRKYSGTSMAAPNAANLAAKVLAVNPSLTTQQLIDLMTRGADPLPGHEGRLILNPKKTVEMARNKG